MKNVLTIIALLIFSAVTFFTIESCADCKGRIVGFYITHGKTVNFACDVDYEIRKGNKDVYVCEGSDIAICWTTTDLSDVELYQGTTKLPISGNNGNWTTKVNSSTSFKLRGKRSCGIKLEEEIKVNALKKGVPLIANFSAKHSLFSKLCTDLMFHTYPEIIDPNIVVSAIYIDNTFTIDLEEDLVLTCPGDWAVRAPNMALYNIPPKTAFGFSPEFSPTQNGGQWILSLPSFNECVNSLTYFRCNNGIYFVPVKLTLVCK